MPTDVKWFIMAGTMNLIFCGYLLVDLVNRRKQREQKNLKFHKQQNKQENRKYSTSNEVFTNQPIATQKKTVKIVFTGGPCAGKTTAMAYCSELLRERGFRIYVVPEAATCIALGGGMINVSLLNSQQLISFQSSLMKMQMNFEDRFAEIANNQESDQPAVLLCDRGVMDGQAYTDKMSWQVLIDEMGFNTIQLRDNRYDAVIHLVTAANGAEEHYSLDNTARYETPQVAVEVDQKLQEAWCGHSKWIQINNSCDFKTKMKRAGEAVLHLMGQASTLTFYKKFILKNKNFQFENGIQHQTYVIEDTFIQRSPEYHERRIRKRGQNDSYVYTLYETKDIKGELVETNRRIRSRDYFALYENRDPKRQTITKTKTIFVWNLIFYSIEQYDIKNQKFFQVILQTEEKQNDKLILPDFLKELIIREITDLPDYLPINMAKIGWQVPEEDRLLMDNYSRN